MGLAIFLALTAFAAYIFHQYANLRRNITSARKSGFVYHLAPFSFHQTLWLALQNALAPLIQCLPVAWSESWLPFSMLDQIWNEGFAPFAHSQTDSVLLVSPSSNVLYTCDAEIISQVTSRRREFLKPMSLLKILNIYGPTLSGSEGEEARLYRKITVPSFNEKTHQQVWTEAFEQTDDMLRAWDSKGGRVNTLSEEMAKLALHVISKVFFGKTLKWQEAQMANVKLRDGHELSYAQAIQESVESNITLFLTPKPVLNISPFAIHKKAKRAFDEWQKYMLEMKNETTQRLAESKLLEQPSLLEALVQASETSPGTSASDVLSQEAVLGNMYLFILAGHETSANTAAIAISLLAYHPSIQERLHQELDVILLDRGPGLSQSFENDYPRLINGYVGALMCETLRLYPTLPLVSKCTEAEPKEIVTENGTYVVPAHTLIVVNIAAAHRNPKYWTQGADDFDPTRWLKTSVDLEAKHEAFLPFSDGYRSCPGKRFAQIEFCAVIARLFTQYSVELVGAGSGERDTGYFDSRVGFEMALKLRKDFSLRFVRREKRGTRYA